MSLVSGGLADSRVKFSSVIPWREEILELMLGTPGFSAMLLDDGERLMVGVDGLSALEGREGVVSIIITKKR